MRRSCAIIKATALEILSEPLVFLVTVSAMVLAVLAPAFHCHAFGDSSRMARDAGVSAVMLGGLVIVSFGAIKSIRREIETQTAMSALALSVSRRRFFLAKVVGVLMAYLVFVITVAAVSVAAVRAAALGGEIAAQTGVLARMYGPVFAAAVGAIVLPFAYGAMVSHSFRGRFTLSAGLCAMVLAIGAMVFRFDWSLTLTTLSALLPAALPALVLLSASAAFSVRFKFNAAASFALLAFALFLPALGNYCLTDVVSAGEPISGGYLLSAFAAVLPPVAALLYLGTRLFEDAE